MTTFILIPILAVVGVMIIVVNLFTLVTMFTSPQLLKPANYPIISFLITAMVQGFFVVPVYCIKLLDFEYKPNWICDVFRFPYFVCSHLLPLNLVLVCIDRIIAIKLPLRYEAVVTRFSMLIGIISEIVVVIIIDLLPFGNVSPDRLENCIYVPWPTWSVSVIILTILLPFAFLTLTYVWIWIIALRLAETPHGLNCRKKGSFYEQFAKRIKKILELRATKTSALLVGVFILCWGPIAIYYMVENLCGQCISLLLDKVAQTYVGFAVKCVSFISSILSPLAYCWRTREFQREFRRNLAKRHWRAAKIALSFLQRTIKETALAQADNKDEGLGSSSQQNATSLPATNEIVSTRHETRTGIDIKIEISPKEWTESTKKWTERERRISGTRASKLRRVQSEIVLIENQLLLDFDNADNNNGDRVDTIRVGSRVNECSVLVTSV